MAHVYRLATQRLAQVSTTTSLVLGIVGALDFAVGGLAYHTQASFMALVLAFTAPPCWLFFQSKLRIQAENFLQAALMSIVGGLIILVDFVAAAISAAYANPCFEIAPCTKGPSLSYLAFNLATFVFLATAVLGLFVSPITIGGSARYRCARGS